MIAQLVFVGLTTGAIYALIAVSLNLIYGTMRLLNIGHGDMAMVGAYISFWLFTLADVPPYVSFLIAPAVSGLFGLLLYRGMFAGLLRRVQGDAVEGSSLLVFFGISMVVQNSASLLFSGTPRAYRYFDGIVEFGGIAVTESRLVALAVAVVAIGAVLAFLKFSIWGLGVRALIQNRAASAIVGINVDFAFTFASVVGFALAGLAGAVISMYQAVTPFMGGPYTTVGFVVIILGGLGNINGAIIGGLVVGLLETAGIALTGPNFRDLLIYGVFIAVLMLRPQGLFGRKGAH
ncbi:branched-chain amino acid ABC transporter permease [Zavarzinia compransoris]|uniref:branched-chain amino acid ABC transporter permease n=1 Tax=Zavarzinia marina TaxID=2911065 RepID=UPI001F2E61DD|nr:branched-chain amino acid ABC transporter permease [Zavarzinia marina]MCF4167371.1 branched-chain amino acid ABC transporter permease [Zavarzinia marina]